MKIAIVRVCVVVVSRRCNAKLVTTATINVTFAFQQLPQRMHAMTELFVSFHSRLHVFSYFSFFLTQFSLFILQCIRDSGSSVTDKLLSTACGLNAVIIIFSRTCRLVIQCDNRSNQRRVDRTGVFYETILCNWRVLSLDLNTQQR